MARRLRIVDGEDCPKCGAKMGEKCRNWKGSNCAPHAIGEVEPRPHTDRRRGKGAKFTQGVLFGEEAQGL